MRKYPWFPKERWTKRKRITAVVARIGWLLFTGYQSFFSPDPSVRRSWKVWFYIITVSLILEGLLFIVEKLSGDDATADATDALSADSAHSDAERASQEQP
jgi:protein-S-isoprenylcysteine O-methyltransferase Ste14